MDQSQLAVSGSREVVLAEEPACVDSLKLGMRRSSCPSTGDGIADRLPETVDSNGVRLSFRDGRGCVAGGRRITGYRHGRAGPIRKEPHEERVKFRSGRAIPVIGARDDDATVRLQAISLPSNE